MAITTVSSHVVSVNAIQGTLIADNAITAVHIATNAVSGTLIADNAITAVHVAQNSITVTQLADDCVESDKIADGVITTNHLNKAMISSQTEVTPVAGDFVLLGDTSDSNNLKKAPLTLLLNSNVDISGKLNLSGGTMTGTIAGFTSTGIDDNADAVAITIDSSENVGIGETSPTRRLSVRKDTGITSGFNDISEFLDSTLGAGGSISFNVGKAASNKNLGKMAFKYAGNSSTSNALNFGFFAADNLVTLLASGKLGIGTETPAYTLSVQGTEAELFNVTNTNTYGRMSLRGAAEFYIGSSDTVGAGSGYYDLYAVAGKGLRFFTGAGERMRIDSSGNVGIGTVTPLSKLHVEGNIGQQATTDKSVSSGVVDSGINIISGVHNTYARGSGRLRVMGTENNLNVGYAEYMYSYSRSSGGTYYINLKFIDEAFVNNTYSRPRLYLYNSSTYNNNSTNRQNTNQTANSTNTNIGQIGITNVADAYGTFQIVVEPMHWKQ